MLAPQPNVIFPLAFQSVNEVQRRPRLLFYISWNINGKFSPLAPGSRCQNAALAPFQPLLQPRGRGSAGARQHSLRGCSPYPGLSAHIVYPQPVPQAEFCPHYSPESSPGPRPAPGCCPESLLHWSHSSFQEHFSCWTLSWSLGPAVPCTVGFGLVGPLNLGEDVPWKHCWWSSGTIPPVLLDTLFCLFPLGQGCVLPTR